MTGTVKTAKTRTNKFAANCERCARRVPAGTGRLAREDGTWVVFCADECTTQANSTDAQCVIELFCTGGCPDARQHDTYQEAHQAARKANINKPNRRATARRACVTGGNCSSHSGHHCGGHDCDAN